MRQILPHSSAAGFPRQPETDQRCWRSCLVFPVMLALMLTGCQLVGDYDEITDQKLTGLAISTETILVRGDADMLPLKDSNEFLTESIGLARALQKRSASIPKNEDETTMLKDLETRLQNLLARNKPLRSSVATGLLLTLADLQQVQTAKKRGAEFEASLREQE